MSANVYNQAEKHTARTCSWEGNEGCVMWTSNVSGTSLLLRLKTNEISTSICRYQFQI